MYHNNLVILSIVDWTERELPDSEKYVSKFDQSSINTVGAKNLDLEAIIANSNSQPQYIFTDESGKIIKNAGGYDSDMQRFISILNDVKAENRKRFP